MTSSSATEDQEGAIIDGYGGCSTSIEEAIATENLHVMVSNNLLIYRCVCAINNGISSFV